MNDSHNRLFGIEGERTAEEVLERAGFSILERNFRQGRKGEIDIIAMKNGLLVFIEVKNRATMRFGGPLYAISQKKKRSMRSVALSYLSARPDLYRKEITCRFDLMAICDGSVEWVEDILR